MTSQNFYTTNATAANIALEEVQVLDAQIDSIDSIELISRNSNNKKNFLMDDISILVDLAKDGKIDPWNIDILDIYDKYLAKLSELEAKNNLKYAGRASLFASILLKIKSNILEGIELSDFEPVEEEFIEDFEDDFEPEQLRISSNNVISFNEVLQRRTSTRLNRNRNVTLKDLIRHVKFYEELEQKRSIQNSIERQKRRVKNYSKLTAHDIKNLAHEEYIEQVVQKMDENLALILKGDKKIEINELTVLGFDRSSAYIALLFLALRKNYELLQDEFYSDLFVQLGEETQDNLEHNDGGLDEWIKV